MLPHKLIEYREREQKYFYDNASLNLVIFPFLKKVFIHLNPRNQANSKIGDLEYDIKVITLCTLTKDSCKSGGSCKGKNRSLRFKFTYPKSRKDNQ
ncbi:hypothetical protein [Hathewaya limosa]|uniref:Uncharacterized protein n=1 Tax=Hathewaya limosa TaxID=1536 RepID=A0ABU0JPV5_HATLI|nr:hypothetical protein [Hathewaya limosa]MDQ0479117.1 hypothetical protein [Hathewaya limosa]